MAKAPKLTEDKVLDAALVIVERDGWRGTNLRAIAAEAGTTLAALVEIMPCKPALFRLLARRADHAMLAEDLALDPRETPRDRLFEVLMRRFDALEPDRARIAILLREAALDPSAMLAAAATLGRSMGFALEAAGQDADGPAGMLRRKGLAAVWMSVLRVWAGDDSPDKARTMAALDKALRRAEPWAGLLRGRFPRRPEAASEAD